MTEPDDAPGRVPDVHAERAVPLNVPGEPEPPAVVFDLESRLDASAADEVYRREFHEFYASSRDRIGRALALTLGDADLVQRALRQVPEDFRVALVLFELCDFTYAEIADHQGVGVQTVKSRLSRARQALTVAIHAMSD